MPIKFTYSSTKEDFFCFYFSQIFLKNDNYTKIDIRFADLFNIDKEKLKSIEITEDEKKNLFLHKNLDNYKEYFFINNYFVPVSDKDINLILNKVNEYIEDYIKLLEKAFFKSNLPNTLEIKFVASPLKDVEVIPNGLTLKFLENKMFIIFFPEYDLNEDGVLQNYVSTILHEITHIFINKNDNFQKVFKEIYYEKYNKLIRPMYYRTRIEEFIVSTLIKGSIKKFGFGLAHKYLNLKEDIELKEKISKSRYSRITIPFIEKLLNSTDEDKLKKFLPEYIEEIFNSGVFDDVVLKSE